MRTTLLFRSELFRNNIRLLGENFKSSSCFEYRNTLAHVHVIQLQHHNLALIWDSTRKLRIELGLESMKCLLHGINSHLIQGAFSTLSDQAHVPF